MEENIRIYYNEQCIYFTQNANNLNNELHLSNAWVERNAKEDDFRICFKRFTSSQFGHLIFEGDIYNQFDAFKVHFNLIQAGGGVVWNDADELLMIHRLGKWDLPKGKLDLGEELAMCAVREVEEETGLHDISLLGIIKSTYHMYKIKNEWVLKQTEWYEMKAPKQDLKPQAEEGIAEAVWVQKTAIKNHLAHTYPNIVFLLAGMY